MALLGNMSRWRGDPAGACRPFDRRRDGWVPGEGAGILILEELEHAEKRGAEIYGEFLGGGSGCDAMPGGGLDPQGSGTEVAITAALEEAGLGAGKRRPRECSRLGHGHLGSGRGTGFSANLRAAGRSGDRSQRVHRQPGLRRGAVELICSLIAVNRGLVPAVLNCDEPESGMELDLVLGSPRATGNPVFVNTNVTPHGQAAAVVVRGQPR